MALKVRDKILIITATTLLLAIGANALIISRMFKKGYSAALQSKMDVIANTLRSQVERLLSLGIAIDYIEGFETQCQEVLRKHRDVAYVMVTRTNGNILFHNDTSLHDTMITNQEILVALKDNKETVCTSIMAGSKYYNTVVPVVDNSAEPGIAVIVGFPTALIDSKIQKLHHYSLMVAIVSLGFATLLLLTILSVSVMKPLFRLVTTIQRIRESSDLDKRVVVKSADEIGVLADAFNEMTENLQKTTTSIDNLNREITERKKVEEQLRKAEEKYRTQFEGALDAILVADAETGIILDCNPAATRLVGREKSELVGKHQRILHPPEEIEGEFSKTFKEHIKEKQGQVLETQIITKNGEARDVAIKANLLEIGGKKVLQGIFRDITKRKKAEASLRKSEERFKHVTECAGDWIWEVNTDGLYTYASPIVEKVLGYKPEEIVGKKHFYDFFAPDVKEELKKAAFKAFANKESVRCFVNPNMHKNGSIVILETTGTPIEDHNGNLCGYRGADRDITERKRAEQTQNQLMEKLESANKELKEFAYIVSHDLKAPLRGVRVLVEWISNDYADKLDEEGKEQMNLLISRVERMRNLIDGILQYSSIGRVKQEMADVNLNELIPDIIDMLAPPKNIAVTIENELPVIKCEQTRIAQVFQNLLSNAIKYMDKPQGQIKVSCAEQNGFWKFSVADNGPGIEEKYFEKIFRMFQTLSPRDEFESTGVGLTVVRKLVESYGGRIWVESNVGQGSTFLFTLPKQKLGLKDEKLQASTVS